MSDIPEGKAVKASADLPVSVKERLLELAARLPESSRGSFLSKVNDRLCGIALDYSEMIVFAAVGWLLGEILDHVLTAHVPFTDVAICLTGGSFSSVGLAGGALFGLSQDIRKARLRHDVAQIIGEELRRALAVEA